MSCQCPEKSKPAAERNWVVTQRNCNHSAFNGYHYTPSDYSSIRCLSCGAVWRTKAGYVSALRDARGPIRWVPDDPAKLLQGSWTDAPEVGDDLHR